MLLLMPVAVLIVVILGGLSVDRAILFGAQRELVASASRPPTMPPALVSTSTRCAPMASCVMTRTGSIGRFAWPWPMPMA